MPASFENLVELDHLTLDDNQLSGAIPEVLATNLEKLIHMEISDNKLAGPIPLGDPFFSFPISSFENNAGC